MVIEKIEIVKEFGFTELDKRLRAVTLRGFPDVNIYRDSAIGIRTLTPEQVGQEVFTPQPSVYLTELQKVSQVAELFSEKGIDIFKLNGGVDYESTNGKGEITEWTIIPSVVEVLPIDFDPEARLDYSDHICEELKSLMKKKGYGLNPEVQELSYPEYESLRKSFKGHTGRIPEICDGSHRIESAIRGGLEQNILFIEGMKPGFPYYAVPKPYRTVHEVPERVEEKMDKTHILTFPGHKLLYRLFPSGGINSGNVRPLKKGFD